MKQETSSKAASFNGHILTSFSLYLIGILLAGAAWSASSLESPVAFNESWNKTDNSATDAPSEAIRARNRSKIVPITEDAEQAETKRQLLGARGGKSPSNADRRFAPSGASAIRALPGCTTNTLPANDDGSTGAITLPFSINFFGTTYSQTFVNNNGNITFTGPLGTFTPFPLTMTNIPIMAPFFADVDTRGPGSGLVQYGADTVGGSPAFCVDWVNVGYYDSNTDLLNSFQLILIDRSDTGAGDFDIEFNYNQVAWETGDASGGAGGHGGNSARVGYANGNMTPGTFFELPGSAVNGALLDSNPVTGLTNNSLNSGMPGRYIFNARNGGIATPTPTPNATPTPTPNATPTATPTAPSMDNISTRGRVETGDSVVIGGFIISGTTPRKVIVRALGPSLIGINGALVDPTLELRAADGSLISANDNWRDTQEAEIEATGLPPTNDLESAIVATLPPGDYTAILRGKNQGTGVGLLEIYDLDRSINSKVTNISTRGLVQTGGNVLIAGFMLGGGTGSRTVVVRGIGPSLTRLGLANVLADPTLELRDSNGTLQISSDNWKDNDAQAHLIKIAGLAPTNDLESALLATLSPGPYTAILAGKNGGTGIALVEVYNLY